MREFIRHPTSFPLHYATNVDGGRVQTRVLQNISDGGLCFSVEEPLKRGSEISIQIPVPNRAFQAKGIVAWCKEVENHYDVGVKFCDLSTESRVRIVEQICHIEEYRNEIKEKEGRDLTTDEAALEWIAVYATGFPR